MLKKGFFIFTIVIISFILSLVVFIPKTLGSGYDYEITYQSPYPKELKVGDSIDVEIDLKNTGSLTWGSNVRLGTGSQYGSAIQMRDYNSEFADISWLSSNRPAGLPSIVTTGETAKFNFTIRVPEKTGLYRAYFTPVVDGIDWMKDLGIYWEINVSDKGSVAVVKQSNTVSQPPTTSVQGNIENDKESLIKANAASVVKIYCEASPTMGLQGSGTLIKNVSGNPKFPEFYILTNEHVVKTSTTLSPPCEIKLFPDYQNPNNYLVYNSVGYKMINDEYDLAYLTPFISNSSHAGTLANLKKYALNDNQLIDNKDADSTGERILVIGYPENGGIDFEEGTLLARSYYEGMDFWDTNALIRHGNSGGLALSYTGDMIGIPTFIRGNVGMILDIDSVWN